jgi:TetR/AcrR family transcriptional repressor of nem operon
MHKLARPREFDHEYVLDKAVEVFWAKGYEATSVQDLVEATGLHRGSIYGAFGNKQQLFILVLDRYADVVVKKLLDILDANTSGKAAIRQFFAAVVEHVINAGPLRGCLVTNSAVERALCDNDTADKVGACLSRIEAGFYNTLMQAQAAGELSGESDSVPNIRAIARYLTSCLQGLLVMGKVQTARQPLEDIVTVTLSVLD